MMETRIARERRAHERILVRCPVRFKVGRRNELVRGSSKDFSNGGLGLFTRSRLEAGMHLEIWVRLFPRIKPFCIGGRVIWAKQWEPGLWHAGICFDEMAFGKIIKLLLSKNSEQKGGDQNVQE